MTRLKTLFAIAGLALFALAPARAALPDPLTFGVAIEAGNLDKARQWLDEGLDAGFLADRVGSGLMIGAWEGNIPMMELFAAHGADLRQQNRYGEQALQLAAWTGHAEAVRWLLDRGAPINRNGQAWSALHYAAFAGHEEVVRLLLERGADVNGRAPNGSTVLMMAAREGHEGVAKSLLAAGADPKPTNDWGDSALTWAMRYGNYRIAQLVSTSEQFAQAATAPPESFGKAIRSEPAPTSINNILRQIRLAEAAGRPTDRLRKALMDAVARYKQGATVVKLKDKPGGKGAPAALVITAGAKRSGERAELVYDKSATPAAAAAGDGRDRLVTLLEQLNQARAEGRPMAEIRKALFQAVDDFKRDMGSKP
ncbi:MAG TPA: ankyrin repeat domain-containing protein [Rhodocyclaceae bacterium]|nr:ankyrin repeat domain-containing protein [Rhodocyclaceae bacterium]